MSTPLNRRAAERDLTDASAAVRVVDDRVFSVRTLWNDERALLEFKERWSGMRTVGTNPTLWDTGDPATLALVIERNHDYPDAAMIGHYITEVI
jgi:hypothetical protein